MKEAYEYLIKNIDINDNVVVACSGGPDSMALLSLLIEVRKKQNINIIVAHVNHNVRKESEDEKIFVLNYCKINNVIFEYMKIEDYSMKNFESEARYKRYQFFDEIIKKYDAKYLFTAHHGDDLMETILMRIIRGSTLRGYSGFSRMSKRNNYSIIRPLIHMTKKEIIQYDDANNIPYVIDKTNFLDIHTRNRLRSSVLPELKKENENVQEKFYKFSELLVTYDDFIEKCVDKEINEIYNDGIVIDKFLKLDEIICMRIIKRIFFKMYGTSINLINDKHVLFVYDTIKNSHPNQIINLPNNVIGIKSYNVFKLINKEELMCNYNIILEDTIKLPNGKSIQKIKKTSLNSNNVIRLSSTDVILPLHVRNVKIGDRMSIMGMQGRKKIKDIFIDEKIPINERQLWPIVVDSNDTIIWIPGLKKSKFNITNDEKCDIILEYY